MARVLQKRTLPVRVTAVEPANPVAELRVGSDAMTLTMFLPGYAPADLEFTLARSSFRIRARRAQERFDFLIPLPVAAEPGRFLVRANHGVYDVHIQRLSTSH